jgi:outer membrane lipoprotein
LTETNIRLWFFRNKEGREITVAGEIAGREALPLAGIQYTYPVILAKEIHLWENRPPLLSLPLLGLSPVLGALRVPYGYPYWRYRPYWR